MEKSVIHFSKISSCARNPNLHVRIDKNSRDDPNQGEHNEEEVAESRLIGISSQLGCLDKRNEK
jgi:hypothetical protein